MAPAAAAIALGLGSLAAWTVSNCLKSWALRPALPALRVIDWSSARPPENASGQVYDVVCAGLNIGQATAPLIFGVMMNHYKYLNVLLGRALVQAVLIVSAFMCGRSGARRSLGLRRACPGAPMERAFFARFACKVLH